MKFLLPSPIANKQAVEELQVFLRTMCVTQRRWAREIAACETHVRKRMMEEDQCRERLRRVVLRGAYDHLKHLVSTDLLLSSSQDGVGGTGGGGSTSSRLLSPDPFVFYGIAPTQVTPFSVYAMSRLLANPSQVDGDALGFSYASLIAEYQTGWSMLSPLGRQQYEQLAAQLHRTLSKHWNDYKPEEDEIAPFPTSSTESTTPPTTIRTTNTTAGSTGSASGARKPCPHQRRRCRHRVGRGGRGSPGSVKGVSVRRQPTDRPIRQAGDPAAEKAGKEGKQKKRTTSSSRVAAPPRATLPAMSWERQAFQNFLTASFAQMTRSLQKSAAGDRHREARLTRRRWAPMAMSEWGTLTVEQKRLYSPRQFSLRSTNKKRRKRVRR